MQRTTRQFTISLPPELADQVAALARAESRTISELFREAFRTYHAGRVRMLLNESQLAGQLTGHGGYTAEDVDRLIHETRRSPDRSENK